jgi:hypothetical protein
MARMRMSMRSIGEALRPTQELSFSVLAVRGKGVWKRAIREYVQESRWPAGSFKGALSDIRKE